MPAQRHVDPNHPLKGRMSYLPALLNPSTILETDGSTSKGSAQGASSPPLGHKRKRPRAARACEFCRSKKYRCDELDPCNRCKKRNQPCIYNNADLARSRLQALSRHGFDVHPDGQVGTEVNLTSSNVPNDAANGQVNEHEIQASNPGSNEPRSFPEFFTQIQQEVQRLIPAVAQPPSWAASLPKINALPSSMQIQATDQSQSSSQHHVRQLRYFLDGYFQSLHYIHPFLDKAKFLSRCEHFWSGPSEQPRSFVALYYAIMSLAAITQESGENLADGETRIEWSRDMFQRASDVLNAAPGNTDLDTLQAYLILTLVCQHQLKLDLAYMYLGRAVRIALSARFNRKSRMPQSIELSEDSSEIVRTWWVVYSVEIELSFALGLPDSLGPDLYHDQLFPPTDHDEYVIIAKTVELARIVREVSTSTHGSAQPGMETLSRALELETKIDLWLESLPKIIRSAFPHDQASTTFKAPRWAEQQMRSLQFRCLYIRMALYRHFLLHSPATDVLPRSESQVAIEKCVSSAKATIQQMHRLYCDLYYFRTYSYNLFHLLYAASVILYYMSRLAEHESKDDLQRHIDMSFEVLHAMEEQAVCKKAVAVLKEIVRKSQGDEKADNPVSSQRAPQPERVLLDELANTTAEPCTELPLQEIPGHVEDFSLDCMTQLPPFDDAGLISTLPNQVQ